MKSRQVLILLITLLGLVQTNFSQELGSGPSDLEFWIDKKFATALDSLNIPGATFALVYKDSILYTKGYGLADVENSIPVSDSKTLFGLTSVSTAFVTSAVMKLNEEGKVNLEDDISMHLKSIRFENKFDQPITIKDLLSHTGGLDVKKIGNQAKTEEQIISITDYLKQELPPQLRPPGKVFTYSNFGYALLALIIQDVSGLPYEEYLKQTFLEPLDMKLSDFNYSKGREKYYSKNYLPKGDSLIAYRPPLMHFYPVAAMNSTAKEMSNYMTMLLNNGQYEGKTILDSITVSKMLSPSFQNYELGHGIHHGFLEKEWNGVQTLELMGNVNGFVGKLMLIPDKNIGLFISVNTANYNFVQDFTDDLLGNIFSEETDNFSEITPPSYGDVSRPLTAFTGKYRYTRHTNTTLEKLTLFLTPAWEVSFVVKNDTLVEQNSNEKLIPVSALNFYSSEKNEYVAFGENENGDIKYFFSDLKSHEKLKWYESLRFQLYMIVSILLVYIIFILGNVIRRLFVKRKSNHVIPKINTTIALLSVFYLFSVGFTLTTTNPFEFTYGLMPTLKIILLIPFGIILLIIWSLYLTIKTILKKQRNFWKFNYLVSLAALFFMIWLSYWNLIGFN